jgi:hypothetical protein
VTPTALSSQSCRTRRLYAARGSNARGRYDFFGRAHSTRKGLRPYHDPRLMRHLGALNAQELREVEVAVAAWLGLGAP